MRIVIAILFLFFANLGSPKAEHPAIVNETKSDLMSFYNAAADHNNNAVQQETTAYIVNVSVRLLPNRTRTASNVNIRQVLLSTHKPAISKLIHRSVIKLIAFPKEYHVFRLRRIRI